MHSVTTAVGGALALAFVLYLGLARFPTQIEQHLLDSTQASLHAAQVHWAKVRVSGRDVHLQGKPPDADTHRYAMRLLQLTRGVRVIVDETDSAFLAQRQPENLPAAPARTPAPALAELPPDSARTPEQAARLCQTAFDALLSGQQVKFVPGKTLISLESADLLQQIAQASMRCESARLEVAAHTDSSGNLAENFSRSQAEAEAIVDYLVSRGVRQSRLEARGYGAQAPIANNRTAAGRERNRRIEITVLRGSE